MAKREVGPKEASIAALRERRGNNYFKQGIRVTITQAAVDDLPKNTKLYPSAQKYVVPNSLKATGHKTVALKHQDGTPIKPGELKQGEVITVNRKTGIVERGNRKKRRAMQSASTVSGAVAEIKQARKARTKKRKATKRKAKR